MATILSEGSAVLSETSSKALLDAYEIPVTKPLPAASAEDALAVAERIGYPVVLKVRSPDITHKTDVGGVATGIETPDEVARRIRAHPGLGRGAPAQARHPRRDRAADGHRRPATSCSLGRVRTRRSVL